MDTDEEAKKVLWSLQNNKRTETERVNFQPTGQNLGIMALNIL